MVKGTKRKLSPPTSAATSFDIYRNLTTGKTPEIIINLLDLESYKAGIVALRGILKTNRESNLLIPFQVYSDGKINTFFMRCSNLYILGYQDNDKIKILKEEDLSYTGQSSYSFFHITTDIPSIHTLGYVVAEAVRSKPIFRYIKGLIEEQNYVLNIHDNVFGISQLHLDLGNAKRNKIVENINNILAKITVYKIAHSWGFLKNKEGPIINKPKILKLLLDSIHLLCQSLQKISTETEESYTILKEKQDDIEYYQELLYSDSDDESEKESNSSEYSDEVNLYESKKLYTSRIKEIEEDLDKIFITIDSEETISSEALDKAHYNWEVQGNELAYYQELLQSMDISIIQKNINTAMDYIVVIHSKMENMEAAIECIPTNSTSTISEGLYELNEDTTTGSYSKIPDSKESSYQLSYSDYSTDDDKGAGAILISSGNEEHNKDTNIEWVNNIDNQEVKEYLLSLKTIQHMQANLEEKRKIIDKSSKIDFVIKTASFTGCMLVKSITESTKFTNTESNIATCSGFSAMSGMAYDILSSSIEEILG